MSPVAERAIAHVLFEEGGLVDDPRDPGGLTHFGISLKEHPELSAAAIRSMTWAEATGIYLVKYWTPIRGDDLPAAVAFVTLDAAANSGVHQASQWLQQALECVPDGSVGPRTIAAAKASPEFHVIATISDLRLRFLEAQPDWSTFGHGWQTRVERVQKIALAEFA